MPIQFLSRFLRNKRDIFIEGREDKKNALITYPCINASFYNISVNLSYFSFTNSSPSTS